MGRIAADKVVALVYTLKDDEGNVIEDRTPENPFVYIHGQDQILPALEETLEGQSVGFCTFLRVAPEKGFGEYQEGLVAEVPKTQFPDKLGLSEGMKFDTTGPNGQPLTVEVRQVKDKSVVVDGNHPLAGLALNFDLRVLEVREPTQEEIDGDIEPEAESAKSKPWLH
ncbi:MAG: peptidylprolyl isomerase [Pseudobdellovibrionaceae bacterium]